MSFKGKLFEGYSNGMLGPVKNPQLAGDFNKVVDAVGKEAGKVAAEASANSGGSQATQNEEKKKAEEKVKNAAVEAFLSN